LRPTWPKHSSRSKPGKIGARPPSLNSKPSTTLARRQTSFKHAGISYTRQAGRVTYDYSAAPDVIGQQQQLKNAQEVAKALGLAIAKTGAPTWRVTAGKDA
jgi:hypothetical protein